MRTPSASFLRRLARPVVGRAWLLLLVASAWILPAVARGDCAVRKNLLQAEDRAQKAAEALEAAPLSAELKSRLDLGFGVAIIPALNTAELIDTAVGALTPADKAQALAWLAVWKQREAADAAVAAAQTAYAEEIRKKDAALSDARKAFDEEQAWLQKERDALRGQPVDDAYLDRASAITRRLRAAYAKMTAALKAFQGCFGDVDRFVQDKDERVARIVKLEAEIARRRAPAPAVAAASPAASSSPPPAAATPAAPPDPAAPGPPGDWYVLESGSPSFTHNGGKLTKFDATGFTFQLPDGASAGVAITRPPPTRIQVNTKVEIVAVAQGALPARSYGYWDADNVRTDSFTITNDSVATNIPNFKPKGVSTTATMSFYFRPTPNATIRFLGGEYDPHDGTSGIVTWKYRKE